MTVLEQLQLMPDEPLELERLDLPLSDLPPDEDLLGPSPDAALSASVRRLGVLQAILVARAPDRTLRVVEGRRRVKAARAAGLATVPAVVAHLSGPAPLALTLLAHATRKANPAADLDAIERLVRLGASERDIARETGVAIATLRQRQRMLGLHRDLRAALQAGAISVAVAEDAAKLPPASQERLAKRFVEEGRLTQVAVDGARRARTESASLALPFDAIASTPTATELEASAREGLDLDILLDVLAPLLAHALGAAASVRREGCLVRVAARAGAGYVLRVDREDGECRPAGDTDSPDGAGNPTLNGEAAERSLATASTSEDHSARARPRPRRPRRDSTR